MRLELWLRDELLPKNIRLLCRNMPKKSLIQTNPFLKDPEKYRSSLIINVSSSTAIETGDTVDSIAKTLSEVSDAFVIHLPLNRKSTSQ